MACCTNNIWTKIIASLTIIFCVAYVGLQLSVIIFLDKLKEILCDQKIELTSIEGKTSILLYCSVVFNCLWIVTSVLLLIFVRKNEINDYSIKETAKLIKVYFSWIIAGFLSFIPDVVAIIMYGLETSSKDDDKKAIALFFLALSSRFIVVLVYHICSWIGIIIITTKLQKSLVEDDSKSSNKRIVPLKPPKPALKPSKVPHLEETNVDRVRDWYKHYEGNDKNSENNYYSEPEVPRYIPRLNGNSNPAFVGNQNYRPVRKPPPPPPPQQSHHMPGTNTNVMVNGVTSGTLRRQLPWSYMPGNGEVPQLPSKTRGLSPNPSNASVFTAVKPYVPAPDYYDKPIKTERQELGHPGWNQYL